MTRVALYLRVSTGEQSVDNQRRELLVAAARRGWSIVGEYVDDGISGAKGRDKRPGFDRLLKAVARHRIDMVAAWSVDRLGRSLLDLLNFLSELHAAGCDLYLERQGLDTSTPTGRAMFQMIGVFAEFEREIIRERIATGIAKAKATGTKSGKPFGRPLLDHSREKQVRELLAAGNGIRKTARLVGTGNGTVARIKEEMQTEVRA